MSGPTEFAKPNIALDDNETAPKGSVSSASCAPTLNPIVKCRGLNN